MTTTALLFALLATTAADGANRPQILDFHAKWCGPCREMRPRIQLLVEKGYPVRSIDVDDSPEIAQKYQVTEYPTFVIVDARGRPIARTKGLQPASKLASLYNEAKAQLNDRDSPDDDDDAPPAKPAPTKPERDEESSSIPRPWETVVRIKIHNNHATGYGSGTIIYSDDEEALILTCAHLFHAEGVRNQYSPARFPYPISIDLFDGKITSLKPAQVHPIATIAGKAVDYDFKADVGLIRIRPGHKLKASPVAAPDWKPKVGVPMITLGCSEGRDATAWSTKISNVGAATIDGRTYSAIECYYAPIQGRSGGGLYTQDGYVVGVCDFADPHNNRGLYAATSSIHRLLDRNRLTALYNPRSPRPDGPLLADRGRSNAPKLRAQSPREVDAKAISMPDPALLGIKLPVPTEDTIREKPRPSETDAPRVTWRAASENRTSVANDEDIPLPGPSRGRVRRSIDDPDDLGESAPSGRVLTEASTLDDDPDRSEPTSRSREAEPPADSWRAARRSRATSATDRSR